MEAQRIRCRYDHRFRDLVRDTGDIELAVRNGVPRSTARDWSRLASPKVITLDVASTSDDELRREVIELREHKARLFAILRLVVVLLLCLRRHSSHYIEFRTMSRDVTCLRVQSEIADRRADGISQSRDIVLSALQTVEGARLQRPFHRSRQDHLAIDDALHPRLLSVQEGLTKGADTMSTWARPFTWKNPDSPDVGDIVRNPT